MAEFMRVVTIENEERYETYHYTIVYRGKRCRNRNQSRFVALPDVHGQPCLRRAGAGVARRVLHHAGRSRPKEERRNL